MMDRRKILIGSLLRWWKEVALEYDWAAPDSVEVIRLEDQMFDVQQEFYAGKIKLSDVHVLFDQWATAHVRR